MSTSSDTVSLSSSSSERVEFGRGVGRHVEEESTSLVAVVGRIPMETVTEMGVQNFRLVGRATLLDIREVVEVLMKFSDKLPTKGLVRVYNLVHPIIDIEGHMAQTGKKNLTFFQTLRKEKAMKAKAAGNIEVPNLQESLVEVHIHGDTKRKAELPARPGKGNDVKKVRATLLRQGSSSGAKGPEAGLIELLETAVRKDIDINLPEIVINSIDTMEPDHLVRTMMEFGSKALILSHRVEATMD
ncbi:hypothetical protein DEO72_LG8g1847 [Vigna unguiculata]|uniref:Uncharacterized protein n=1 Tax=Vigna unguiculata TaxID=3917 RepID=A0A4D6MUL9_VIGUN|nr:hypothetical protein DEO72_LG8g1847 [Vigna unguiculata]